MSQQIESATNRVATINNVISANILESDNNKTVVLYKYSDYIYIRIKNMSDMTDAANGTYKVRVWYKP